MPSPSQRIDLLSRRLFHLATVTTNPKADNIDARSLYVGFRALSQFNFRNHHNQSSSSSSPSSSINFEPLFNLFGRCGKSMPVQHIPPCLFVLTHSSAKHNENNRRNRNNNDHQQSSTSYSSSFSVKSADWEIHQKRLATSFDGAVIRELSPEDSVSLLHSLATHGSISPVLRRPLLEKVAQVIGNLQISQLCSIFYSLAIVGLTPGAPESHALTSRLQNELQYNSKKGHLFSMQDLARVIPKVANSMVLNFKSKVELVEPLLPRLALLLRDLVVGSISAHDDNSNDNRTNKYLTECSVIFLALAKLRQLKTNAYSLLFTHLCSNNFDSLNSRQKVVVLFALFSAGEVPDVVGTLPQKQQHGNNNTNNNNTSLSSGIKWYALSCLKICKNESEIEYQLQNRYWDHVTLSYFITSLSFAVDFHKQQQQQQQQQQGSNQQQILPLNQFEHLQELQNAAIKVSNKRDADHRGGSSRNQNYSSSSSRDKQQQYSFKSEVSSKAQNLARGMTTSSEEKSGTKKNHYHQNHQRFGSDDMMATTRAPASTASIRQQYTPQMNSNQKLQYFLNYASSALDNTNNNHNSSNRMGFDRREIEQHIRMISKTVHFPCVPTNKIVAYLRTLGRLRVSASLSSSNQNYNSSNTNNNDHTKPYDGALSAIFGEYVQTSGGTGGFANNNNNNNKSSSNNSNGSGGENLSRSSNSNNHTSSSTRRNTNNNSNDYNNNNNFQQQQKKFSTSPHENDPQDEPGPRSLFPSEAATVLVVLSRIAFRRPYLISRLCSFIEKGSSEISLSLKANALHSLSDLRFPHRGCFESIIFNGNDNNTTGTSMMTSNNDDDENNITHQHDHHQNTNDESSSSSLSLSSIIRKHYKNKNNNNNKRGPTNSQSDGENNNNNGQKHFADTTLSPLLSQEIQHKGTIVNAVHCLIGISGSDNLARYRDVTKSCLTRLLSHYDQIKKNNNSSSSSSLISRSLKIQLPVALSQLGLLSSKIVISNKSTKESALFFKEDQYRQTSLGDHWLSVLLWKHAVSPHLYPDTAAEYEKDIAAFVQHKLKTVYVTEITQYQDRFPKPKLSRVYQLACGFETDSFPLSGVDQNNNNNNNNNKNDDSSDDNNNNNMMNKRLEQINAFASRLKFANNELQRNTESILPSCYCLAKIYEELLRTMYEDEKKKLDHHFNINDDNNSGDNNNDNKLEINLSSSSLPFQSLQSIASELHGVLETNCIRSVSRSDDLALMLFSMRNFLGKACDYIFEVQELYRLKVEEINNNNSHDSDEEGNNNNIINNKKAKKQLELIRQQSSFASLLLSSSSSGSLLVSDETEQLHNNNNNFTYSSSSSSCPVSSLLESNAIPLCRSIIAALYIRESAPGIGSISSFREQLSASSSSKMMTVPTSQLTCVGLRLLCSSLEDGILFEGEEEMFEIALAVVSLSVPRLEGCLSAFDAASCLKNLMSLSSAFSDDHQLSSLKISSSSRAGIFTVMDTLSKIVQEARRASDGGGENNTMADTIPEHHQQLCASVLPGLGQAGQESSVLSL